MSRLPTPGGDENVWGEVLNEFLKVEHNTDGTLKAGITSADKVKLDGIQSGAQVNSVVSVAGRTGAISLTKSDVGLSSVDDTADLDKPVSNAVAVELAKLGRTITASTQPPSGTPVDGEEWVMYTP